MYNSFSRDSAQNSSGVFFGTQTPMVYVYPKVPLLFLFVRHSKSTSKGIIHTILCIIIAYCKQLNALEGLFTNAIRQREMAYIAFPDVAW